MSQKRKIGDELQLEGSTITTELEQETFNFRWNVANFLNMTTQQFSPIFTEGEKSKHEWKLAINPEIKDVDKDVTDKEYVGVYLHLEKSSSDEPVEVKYIISFVSGTKIFATNSGYHKYDSNDREGGGFLMMRREDLLDSTKNYLTKGNTLTVYFEVTVVLGWMSQIKPKKKLKSGGFCAQFELLTAVLDDAEFSANVENFSSRVVRQLFEFLCTGEVTSLEDSPVAVLQIAAKLNVTGLKKKCEDFLDEHMNVVNATAIISLAENGFSLFKDSPLEAKAISFTDRWRNERS